MTINHLKHLGKNSILFGIGYAMPVAINVLLLPIYVRYLTLREYGFLALLNAFGAIAGVFMSLSVDRSIERFYIDYDKEERRKFLGSSICSVLLYALSVGVILTLFAPKISAVFFKETKAVYVYCTILQIWTTFFLLFSYFASSVYIIREKSFTYTIVRSLNFLMLIGGILYFLLILRRGLAGIFEAMFLIAGIMAIIYVFILLPEIRFKIAFSHIKTFLRYSLPLMVSRLFLISIAYIDRFYINDLLSLGEVGIYSVGARFSMMTEVVISSFAIAWFPFYCHRVEGKDSAPMFGKLATLWITLLILSSLAISVFAKEILAVFTTSAYYSAYSIIPVLALGNIFLGLSNFPITSLLYSKKTGYMPLISAVACGANILFITILTPKLHMLGPAFAKAMAYLVMWVLAYIFAPAILNISYEYKRLFKVVGGALVVYLVSIIVSCGSLLADIIIKSLILIFYVALLQYFDVIDISRLRLLFSKEKS